MTEPAKARFSGKRLLLVGSLAGLAIAAAWITYFLISFDLNNYRQELESRLTVLLGQPVKIGAIRYNLHNTNLALRFTDLQIGNGGSPVQVEAEDVLINLQWRGLLKRQFKFAKVSLMKPDVLIRWPTGSETRPDESQTGPAPITLDPELLSAVSIHSLEIIDGTLRVAPSAANRAEPQIALAEVNGRVSVVGLDRDATLTLNGRLLIPGQRGGSSWEMQGQGSLRVDDGRALAPHLDLGLKLAGLDFGAAWALLSGTSGRHVLAGTGDLDLHITGVPAEGIDVRAEFASDSFALVPGPAYTKPLLFKRGAASGRLQMTGDQPGISNLAIQVDDTRLKGRIDWTASGEPFAMTVTLLDSRLPTERIKGWLPDGPGPSWDLVRHNLQDQGFIHVQQVQFKLLETAGSDLAWQLVGLKGECRQIAWQLSETHLAEIDTLPFEVDGRQWQVHGSRGKIGSLAMTLDGQGHYEAGTFSLDSVDFSGAFQPDRLLEEWRLPSNATVAQGTVEVKGHLEGPLNKISLDMQADLSQFSISHPSGLHFTPAPDDKLALHATLSPEKVSLDHGSFKWSMAKGHLAGAMLLDDPDSLTVDAMLSIEDLRRLAEIMPLLEKLQLHGQADLSVHQAGLPRDNPPELTLTLRDAGLRATEHIADLEQINGRVRLTTTGLEADNLHLHLGQSLMTVQANIADFSDPNLVLDVQGPAVRASELVFNSDKAMLRDISGHLEIDRHGLSFAPVDVRLDGGTVARVRGTISFLPPYKVDLDITSEFANIAEVISLWTDHPDSRQDPAVAPGPEPATDLALAPETPSGEAPGDEIEHRAAQTTVRIAAWVRRGDLYGMRFNDAKGVIIPSHERLTIHPLDFSVGEGFCNAQVISDFSHDGPSLLRVSGHAEGVDALEVYQELLHQKNIVRGKLRGDFYLIGETGPNYLPSSYGNFSIQIHDGVLHEFQFLSKVFSLLNVSQIFALQLPDMDTEGMPFNTLSANMQMEKGVLRSDDLKIRSEAMNQFYTGELNLVTKQLQLALAIHPLGTVDKIVSRIPIAGWLLTGDDGALLSAHFTIKGTTDDVTVEAMPLDTLTEPTIGLLKRSLQLPFKLFEDPQILWGGESSKK